MEINGSKVRRTYLLQDGQTRLHVTADRKIWIFYRDATTGSHIANLGDRNTDKKITKDNVCRAANCW